MNVDWESIVTFVLGFLVGAIVVLIWIISAETQARTALHESGHHDDE